MKSLATLLPKLLKATVSGKLVWEKPASPHEAGYWVRMNILMDEFKIDVWEWADHNDPQTTGYSVRLSDNKGGELDEIVADDFSPHYPQVRELYLAARRSALKVDAVIDSLGNYLDLLS